MELTINNDAELTAWMKERMRLGHDMASVKRPPPDGATYGDGTLIVRPVNIRWVDVVTEEVFDIDYSAARAKP